MKDFWRDRTRIVEIQKMAWAMFCGSIGDETMDELDVSYDLSLEFSRKMYDKNMRILSELDDKYDEKTNSYKVEL